jgi:4-amino-4-deoxy-L-arabinose transferase-like glycosyltransferase
MQQSLTIQSGFLSRRASLRVGAMTLFVLLYASLFAHMTQGAPGPFAIDESVYIAMADAMATRGDLAIQSDGGVEGAPSMIYALSGYGADGRVYPQYPAGYAYIAAPFYAVGGVAGLFFLNAIAGLAALYLTYHIARRLYRDEEIALWSAGLLAAATYFSTYAFAVWPHMLTLAILLGAAAIAIDGADRTRISHLRLATSGALIGAAALVRVDSVIYFAAIFAWLRLFAAPQNRLSVVSFFAGAAPVLALAAWFNIVKYGIASPVSYGEPSDYETARGYAPLAIAALTGAGALMIFDMRKLASRARGAIATRNGMLAVYAAAMAALIICWRPLSTLAHHFWTLLFDLQAYNGDYFHDVLTRDGKGFLTTFGMPKKALFQSMPFFLIVILAIAEFFRGKNVRAAGFCLLFAAAPIVFFGVKQWHGGYALNMRFFFPAIPFLTILSAAAITHLMQRAHMPRKTMFRNALAGFAALVALQAMIISFAPGYAVAGVTYPQLAVALGLGGLCCVYSLRERRSLASALLAVAGVSIGVASASSFGDYQLTKVVRDQSGAVDAYFLARIPKGSLIISFEEARLSRTFLNGVSMLHPYEEESINIVQAINAFDTAGRCVYIRKGDISDLVSAVTDAPLVDAASDAPQALNWFETLEPRLSKCRLP